MGRTRPPQHRRRDHGAHRVAEFTCVTLVSSVDNVDSCQWVAIIFEHAFGAGTVATALDLIEAGYAMLAHESFETQTHPELLAVQSRLEAVSWKQPHATCAHLHRRTQPTHSWQHCVAVARSIGDDPDKSGSGVRDVTRIWVSGVRGVLLHLRSSNSACRISCGRDTSRSRQQQHDLRVMPRGAPGTAPRCSRVLFAFDSRWNPRAQ